MPDPGDGGGRLSFDADLTVEVDDGGRHSSARLTGGPGGLVLDVDEPAALLAAVSWRRLAGRLPVRPPAGLLDGVSVRVRSAGRDLGRVRLTPAGRVRVRPTPAGLVAVLAADLTARRSLAYGGVAVLAAVAAGTAVRRLRRR